MPGALAPLMYDPRMESRACQRAAALLGVVVAAVLCDSTAWQARAEGVIPEDGKDWIERQKCPAYATVRPGERTKLGFSPDDALRALRVVPRRLHFNRETPMFGGAHLFAELRLSPATPDDEAVLSFVASGAPSTYCPAFPDRPLWIPGTLTVQLSRGQMLTDPHTSLGAYAAGGRPANGSFSGAALVGRIEVRIVGGFKADSSDLSLWTGNGSNADWFEVRRANDTAGAPDLREALKALGGRPMSCGGRSPHRRRGDCLRRGRVCASPDQTPSPSRSSSPSASPPTAPPSAAGVSGARRPKAPHRPGRSRARPAARARRSAPGRPISR